LQFCEDIGADAMFVANVGLSCGLRNGDFTTDLDAVVQDIRNAIEYAMGDKSTTWGAKRAAAGHPEPFKLKYVELGN
jgi:alpha-N-arabinofuranosidase